MNSLGLLNYYHPPRPENCKRLGQLLQAHPVSGGANKCERNYTAFSYQLSIGENADRGPWPKSN